MQFWDFVQGQGVLRGILDDAERRYASHELDAEGISRREGALVAGTEAEAVGIAYFVVKKCFESNSPDPEEALARQYSNMQDRQDLIDRFMSLFIAPLHDYLGEQLDDRRLFLALLRRYKQKCEWYARDRLYKVWRSNTRSGEHNLAPHLYEYLHDQDIDVFIEPASAGGRADAVSRQESRESLLVEVKIFNPTNHKGTSYLASGVKQVYSYAVAHDMRVGYLVIYRTSSHDLEFDLRSQIGSTPVFEYNNRSIFILDIDIYSHQQGVSARGRLTPYRISHHDLVTRIEEGGGREVGPISYCPIPRRCRRSRLQDRIG